MNDLKLILGNVPGPCKPLRKGKTENRGDRDIPGRTRQSTAGVPIASRGYQLRQRLEEWMLGRVVHVLDAGNRRWWDR